MQIWRNATRWILGLMVFWSIATFLTMVFLENYFESHWKLAEENSLRQTASSVARLVAASGIRPVGSTKELWNLMESESNIEATIIASPANANFSDSGNAIPEKLPANPSALLTPRPVKWAREPMNRYLIRTEVYFPQPLHEVAGLRFSRTVRFRESFLPYSWKAIGGLWGLGMLGMIAYLAIPARQFNLLVSGLQRWSQYVEKSKGDHKREFTSISLVERMIPDFVPSLPSALDSIQQGWGNANAASQRTANILNGMREGVLTVDSQLKVVFANPAACRLLEISNKSFVGKPLLEVVRLPLVCELLQQALLDDGQASLPNLEKSMEIGSFQKNFLRLRASRLPAAYGSGAILTISDETQIHRLENMRREFTANVSHELKTPLAAIKAYAETLLMGALEDETHSRKFVERISEQSNRLENLIQDLLKLARIQAAPNLNPARIEIEGLTKQTMDAYAAVAEAKGVALCLKPNAKWFAVQADREGVTTILNNLVGNAVRYTEQGGRVDVVVEYERQRLRLSVRDTGLGIASEDRDRIFERFYRVDKARTTDAGGTGLGLSIVKNLVVAMNGEIRLESELGKGSHFEVFLPVLLLND